MGCGFICILNPDIARKIIYIMMLSDMENLLSVWENVLSMAKVTKCGQYCIKEKESAIISKIVINFYIVI